MPNVFDDAEEYNKQFGVLTSELSQKRPTLSGYAGECPIGTIIYLCEYDSEDEDSPIHIIKKGLEGLGSFWPSRARNAPQNGCFDPLESEIVDLAKYNSYLAFFNSSNNSFRNYTAEDIRQLTGQGHVIIGVLKPTLSLEEELKLIPYNEAQTVSW